MSQNESNSFAKTPSWVTNLISRSGKQFSLSNSANSSSSKTNLKSKIPLSSYPSKYNQVYSHSDRRISEFTSIADDFFQQNPECLKDFMDRNIPNSKLIPKKDIEFVFGKCHDDSDYFLKATAIFDYVQKRKARIQRYTNNTFFTTKSQKKESTIYKKFKSLIPISKYQKYKFFLYFYSLIFDYESEPNY